VDEKEEDKSEESLHRHLIFYKKLNKKISDIQSEIQISTDEKILKHLKERIDAIVLDQTRIREMFPNVDKESWKDID
jgi:hypothetical protein